VTSGGLYSAVFTTDSKSSSIVVAYVDGQRYVGTITVTENSTGGAEISINVIAEADAPISNAGASIIS
jgi:hypothetical protein